METPKNWRKKKHKETWGEAKKEYQKREGRKKRNTKYMKILKKQERAGFSRILIAGRIRTLKCEAIIIRF